MDIKGYFLQGVEMVKLNRDTVDAVAADEDAFGPAVLFVFIGGLAAGIGVTLYTAGGGFFMLVFSPLLTVVGSFIGVGILWLIARLLGGVGSYKAYYSALGIGSLPGWAQIIPALGMVVSIWCLVEAVIITERVHKVSTGKAVAIILVPVVIFALVIAAAVVLAGMAVVMGMWGLGSMLGGQ